jgi:hypothetical protein
MHQLAQVRIHNFRSCRDVSLTLGDCTPIVGYNNAGKSNLLDALAWFVAPTSLRESDFHDPQFPVAVAATIRGLGDEILDRLDGKHRGKIEPLIDDGALTLQRIQYEPGVPARQIKLQVPDQVEADGTVARWKDQPGGIPEALKALFPESITIGAMEDAAEDATKAKTSSTIGKLLAEFTGPAEASHGDELQRVLAALTDKLTADGAERADELVRFDQGATEALRPFFPGIQLHLDIPVPTVRDLFGKGTIKVSERGRDDAGLRECLRQIKAMADDDPAITIGGNGRPCGNNRNPGNKKPAAVFREWAATPEARPVAQALHDKLRPHNIWLWTGGDIEHHLGLSGEKKDITTWSPFRRRLERETYRDVIADTATIEAFVHWLAPPPELAP